jgi:flagellar hook-associated protein 2
MAELSIPGVSDKYKTNDYIQALMAKERIPLTREQDALTQYKDQQSAWRGINQKMTTLRESVKTLYSFDNPFNNKIASSSDENSITADAGRDAAYDSLKIDVLNPASSDRFLSDQIDKDATVPSGTYTYVVSNKTVSMNWNGGKITDFVSALNKRGDGVIKATLIGVDNNKQALLIESLKTGNENMLIFKDNALDYALEKNIIQKAQSDKIRFGLTDEELKQPPEASSQGEQDGLPPITKDSVKISQNGISVPPRSGFSIQVPPFSQDNASEQLEFSFSTADTPDITTQPVLPDAGSVEFSGIKIENAPSNTTLKTQNNPLTPVKDLLQFFIQTGDNSEQEIDTSKIATDQTGQKHITLPVQNYPDIKNIIVRNNNTGTTAFISDFALYNQKTANGYKPVHPISTATDATIKYEGITMSRPSNTIDDIVPHVTLHIHEKTAKTATIDIKPDKTSAKDALIKFVGNYNQVLAEMNILSENKPEIVSELDYLNKDEQDAANKRLGMFQGDFTLSNSKTSLQQITSANYRWKENAPLTMLSQIGISTRASNNNGSYAPSQFRGYLEIDEKKLDTNLDNNLDSIKNIFGYDSDGDLIIDSGIGYSLDKQLTAWVRSGGIITTKTNNISSKITTSESNIKKLQAQLDAKEAQLKEKYGQMEGTLNNLQSQSTTLNNYTNSGNKD